MTRWGLTSGKNVVTTEKDAKQLFPKELWNKLHLQIIFYGREYSPARGWDLEKDVITSALSNRSLSSGENLDITSMLTPVFENPPS